MTGDKLGGKKTLNVGGFLNEFEKDDIKRRVDIVQLFAHFGVQLEKKGKNLVARCPWHDDKTPSLSVDPDKGLYNCFGCGESGDVFSLVEKMNSCGFREALSFLKSFPVLPAPILSATGSAAPVRMPEEPAEEKPTVLSNISLDIVCDFYHKKIYENTEAFAYLTETRKIDPELIRRFKLGYADGGLLKIVSNGQREGLQSIGILKKSESLPGQARGRVREHFGGCITFPITDNAGQVVHMYGRKATEKNEIRHLYLGGSHRSVFNRKASRVYDEIILVESIIDCLSLITLSIENVQPLYGVSVLTAEHLELLKSDRVKTIVLAFDADSAGRDGVMRHRETLLDAGFCVKTIVPPKGKDWNDCLLSGIDRKAIQELVEKAVIEALPEVKEEFRATKDNARYIFEIDSVTYRIAGVKELFVSSLRVQVKAEYGELRHWDSVDLYASKSRSYLSGKLALAFDIEAKAVEKHLVMILEYLEDERDKKLASLQGKTGTVELSEEEKKLGMAFLTAPDMFDRIAEDMETLGYVGETLNKQLIYIAASSRKLDDPISILIISSSSAGKSYLVETVRELMPEEDVVAVTSLSDQALNYIPDGGLVHKFLILGEAVHSDIIEHQIRDMLSDHRLSRMVTTKDEKTGKMMSENLKTECIVALVMSSTRHEVNPENASRCFIINADETEEQTLKIHASQRNKYSLDRHFAKQHTIPAIKKKHTSAQRLLRNILIVNPFGAYLNFPAQLVRTRRDNGRFMDLIACTCFLRQYQKEVKHKADEVTGEQVSYIECDIADYRIAYNIMVNGVLSSTFSELPGSVVKLYEAVRKLFHESAEKHNLKPLEVSLTQRDIRAKVKWMGSSAIKQALRKLVYLEYLTIAQGKNRGMRNSYALISDEPVERLDCSMVPAPEEIEKRIAGQGKEEIPLF